MISGLTLLLGYFILGPLYHFDFRGKRIQEDGLEIMTFNVREFNDLEQMNQPNIDSLIVDFIESENPDIICLQEAPHYLKSHRSEVLKSFDYKFIDFVYGEPSDRVIQAVYSKYPIVNTKIIDFPKSYNSAMYADVLIAEDTVRLFNLHLESLKITPRVSAIQKENSKKLLGRLHNAFVKQMQQAKIVEEYIEATDLPTIVVGDFNNTQFSSVYQTIKGDMTDTFIDKGKGFGKTYGLFNYPMRIDYILADDSFEVLEHKNYDVELSDHYPVLATLKLNKED